MADLFGPIAEGAGILTQVGLAKVGIDAAERLGKVVTKRRIHKKILAI